MKIPLGSYSGLKSCFYRLLYANHLCMRKKAKKAYETPSEVFQLPSITKTWIVNITLGNGEQLLEYSTINLVGGETEYSRCITQQEISPLGVSGAPRQVASYLMKGFYALWPSFTFFAVPFSPSLFLLERKSLQSTPRKDPQLSVPNVPEDYNFQVEKRSGNL